MKKVLNLFLIFISILSFSQSYRAIYQLTFKPNIEKDSLLKDYYNLDVFPQENKSEFYNYSFNKNDSIFNALMKKSTAILKMGDLPKPKLPLAVKYKEGTMHYFETLDGDSFQFSDKIPVWKISNENKKINDWNCIKAETDFKGRKWTAWFCPELSFSDGPYKFKGLPGLIIEVYDADNDYHFTAEALTKIKNTDFFPKIYANPILTTKKKFEKLLSNYKKDPAGKLRQGIYVDEGGRIIHFTSGLDKNFVDQVVKERLKKMKDFNNQLEL